MIRIAIVEDETACADQLEGYLRQYEQEKKEAFQITRFTDGDEIVERYKAEFDIILMDIQMRFMDGMSAAEFIRKVDTEVVIIFITNMRQYAIRGYAVDAMDYVIKPVTYFAFSERLTRAIRKSRQRARQNLVVNIKGGMLRMDIGNIYYVESQGHTLIYHTSAGNYESSGTLKDIESQLEDHHFFLGNKGYLINLAHVDGVRDNEAIVKGEPLLLSRRRKPLFMEALTDYWNEVK